MPCILFKYSFYLLPAWFYIACNFKIRYKTCLLRSHKPGMLIYPNVYLLPLKREFFICKNWLQNLVCWKCIHGVQEHVILTKIWPKYELFCNIQIKNIYKSQSAIVLSWSQICCDHMLKNLPVSLIFLCLLLWI